MGVTSIIKGLRLLRHPQLIQDLGERRFHLERVAELGTNFPLARFHRDIILIGYKDDLLSIGQQSTLSIGSVLAFGDAHNGFGRIKIGAHTWIGQYNNVRAGGGDIVIGDHCLISQFCSLVAANHGLSAKTSIRNQPSDTQKTGVVLEDDVWLGAGVSILPGVTIAKGAVVGAGSVVTRHIPLYEIWAGAPAKKIGVRDP